MATVVSPKEERIILRGVSWQTYERLLTDLEDQSAPRLTYDRGVLEIMSPTTEHEESNRAIALLVEVLAEELGNDLRNLGSTTFSRADLERGFEPDSCFYIQNAERIEGKVRLDMKVDPPPDLVVEIDITNSSLNKLPIFAQFRVPEVWRYDGEELTIFQLTQGEYVELEESVAFPLLTWDQLTQFIEESKSVRRTIWLRRLRDWVHQHRQS